MPTITIRLFHHPSRTPIAELQGVDSNATLSSLRALAEQHLAAEEACMMRVFPQWHVEVTAAGRKRVVELTAQDEAASLSSLGIEDYSEVLLEGPLTDTVEGVGQTVSIVAAQVREQNSQLMAVMMRMAEGISDIGAGISTLVAGQGKMFELQLAKERITVFPGLESDARIALATEERRAFVLLWLQKTAERGCFIVAYEEAKERGKLLAAARLDYQRILPFAIDTTTPRSSMRLEGPHTAVKITDKDFATLRSSQPLSATNHRWAVRIHQASKQMDICLGLLPKLSAEKEAKLGRTHIDSLGGWCINQDGRDSNVFGDWQCEPFPLAKGSFVLFDYSFSDKTLTIRCGGKQVVGHIPNAGEELYPAFTLFRAGEKVSFEKYAGRTIFGLPNC